MQSTHRKYNRGNGSAWYCRAVVLIALHSLPFGEGQGGVAAQIIDPSPAPVSISEPHFNRTFIRQNKVRTITASVVDKPDGEIIRDKGLAQVYLFDTAGNLSRHFFNEITSLVKTETDIPAVYKRGRVVKKSFTKVDFEYQYDTLGTEYFYTSTGFLIMKRVCIGDFYHSTYYEYFGDGLLSRQTLCKETNIAKPGDPFKLGVQTVLSEEKFEYEQLTPTQVKKKFLNDEGKPYKQGILNFMNGKPIDESYQFVVGFIRSGVTYSYDTQARLTEKLTTDNSSGITTEKVTFEYDEKGNVKTEKKFKNGIQLDEIVYLYGSPNSSPLGTTELPAKDGSADRTERGELFLISQIDRQMQKSSIRILKYEYAFY